MTYEVTIGIPVYNAVRYVGGTLQSALAQDFASIEFLVLDDCGTDGSIDIVRSLQQSHPRGADIRIVRQPRNMGIGHGRNRIIDEARGRYLFFLDADDELPPRAISTLYGAARQWQAQMVYGSCERVIDYGSGQHSRIEAFPAMQLLTNDDFGRYAYAAYGNIPANVWRFLIDVRVYRDHHLRFPDINFWEDFAMTIDLPLYVSRAVFVPDVTYRYYQRYGTLSNNQQRSRIAKDEIVSIARAIGRLNMLSPALAAKPYAMARIYKVVMTEFYIVCYVLKHRAVIQPGFSPRELRDLLRPSLPVGRMLRGGRFGLRLLVFRLLAACPPSLAVAAVRMVGRMRRLV